MNLGKIQLLSIATKAITTLLGIAQSIIIIRILSPAEFGIIGLVMSIGGVIGVSQNLGVVDGAIREIAIRKNKRDIGTVFWVSHIIRQAATIPLSILLALLASIISVRIYHRPEMVPFIQIFAFVLILQGLQDVLGATLTGMKKFVSLYVIQIVTATVNIAVFGFLTWKYHIEGFFWAIIVTTLLMVVLIGIVVGKELAGNLTLPSWKNIRSFGKNLLYISVYMYISRIFYVIWQRLPLLILGGVVTADQLGYLNVSLTFGSKLVILAAALSEVNLSWMSTLYSSSKKEFLRVVTRTMHRVLLLLSFITIALISFVPEILHIIIRKPAYYPATPFIITMTIAFLFYSLIDIGTSSMFVSANKPKLRAIAFGILTLVAGISSGIAFFAGHSIAIAVIGMCVSAIIAYIFMAIAARRMFALHIIPLRAWIILGVLAALGGFLYTSPSLGIRIGLFVLTIGFVTFDIYRNFITAKPAATPRTTSGIRIICFAGALYDQSSWTNRQHVMHGLAKKYEVLYVEPRVWIIRYIAQHLFSPKKLEQFFMRLLSYEHKKDGVYVKAQWNLIPGSREFSWISFLNHKLNARSVHRAARNLGFLDDKTVIWIYDTESAEYLRTFPNATVVYDCVDNHAAQAGVNRNSKRVHNEERQILRRADLVTVTSKRLFKTKRKHATLVKLVLNAGDVELYKNPTSQEAHAMAKKAIGHIAYPIIGSVGALDSYKYDFDLLLKSAEKHPDWNFVFVGSPIVDRKAPALKRLTKLKNVHMIGTIPREHVPAYVEYFDVCIIPYKDNEYNRSSFPLKFWEFMATGKPIVAAGVPELTEYEPLIGYATSQRGFNDAIAQQLKKPDAQSKERKSLAYKHGYAQRVRALEKLLLAVVKQKV